MRTRACSRGRLSRRWVGEGTGSRGIGGRGDMTSMVGGGGADRGRGGIRSSCKREEG